jgi:hypothetical protein
MSMGALCLTMGGIGSDFTGPRHHRPDLTQLLTNQSGQGEMPAAGPGRESR